MVLEEDFDMVNQVTQSEGYKGENKIKQIPNTDH